MPKREQTNDLVDFGDGVFIYEKVGMSEAAMQRDALIGDALLKFDVITTLCACSFIETSSIGALSSALWSNKFLAELWRSDSPLFPHIIVVKGSSDHALGSAFEYCYYNNSLFRRNFSTKFLSFYK